MSTEDYRQPDHRDHPETQTGVTNPAPTPRTIQQLKEELTGRNQDYGTVADLVDTLERELTEARATLLAREGELDSMSAALAAKDAEIARLNRENDSLRTLWTEARDVVTQGRNANCLVSYGKAQLDAVATANAWLNKMPAPEKRSIDDASNAEWQLQRVTAERDQLRAEVEQYKQDFRDQEKRIQAAHRDLSEVTADRNIKRQLIEKLRAALAAAQEDRDEHCARAASLVFKLGDVTCAEVRQWRDEYKANLAAMQKTLDWAESLLCNAKPPSHCTQDEWDELVHKWRDQKHRAAIDQARKNQ